MPERDPAKPDFIRSTGTSQTVRAYCVHLVTASGAVFAMLALLEAVRGAWAMMFLWLVVAFIIDGIDGPLARRYRVKQNAPVIDGGLLDLIIDYLTYVFIPAFALFQSGLLSGWSGWVALGVIISASALYFADTRMKTADNSFQGFPACWNMVAVVIFATRPPVALGVAVILLLAASMFVRLKFIHPVRTRRWRRVTLPVAVVWTVLAGWAAWADFDQPAAVTWGLIAGTLYLGLAGAAQQALPRLGWRQI